MKNIQILGLRSYFSEKTQKHDKAEKFFDKRWRMASVEDVLKNHEDILKDIPKEERYNLYFTVSQCLESPGRKLLEQNIIPFDIDHVNPEKCKDTWHVVMRALGLIPEEHGALWSGHGLQVFIASHEPISEPEYFTQNRDYYRECCAKIDAALARAGLAGTADPAVWSPARLMRMPGTINRKPEKGLPDVLSYVLNDTIALTNWSFIEASGVPVVKPGDQISQKYMANYPEADVEAILGPGGCDYLQWVKDNPNSVSELQWYASTGTLEFFPGGRELVHAYSRGYTGYSVHETNRKADQARRVSGPRTCANIDTLWPGCKACPHYGKVTSPIMIKGESFVASEKNGFYSITVDKNGMPKKGKPEVNDMVKYIEKKVVFKISSSKILYLWNGKHWEKDDIDYFFKYSMNKFNPVPPTHFLGEVKTIMRHKNNVAEEWFNTSTDGYMNMANGIYSMEENKMISHNPNHGFRHVLPFDYPDKEEDTSIFDKFMDDITCQRPELTTALLEFMGYCLSGDTCWAQKCLMITGEGANGKSKFLDLLKNLTGKANYSAVSMGELTRSENARLLLENKLFNVSSETGANSIYAGEIFKAMVAGDEITVKQLYVSTYSIVNKAKLILSCNEAPHLGEANYAMFRRMIMIPFDATFRSEDGTQDPYILDKLLTERSGIFLKAMKAYKEMKKRGSFSRSEVAEAQKERFMEESDVIKSWFLDTYTVVSADVEEYSVKADIYQDYTNACKMELGVKPKSSIMFFRQVRKFIKDLDGRTKNKRMNDGSFSKAVFGILKKSGAENGY